MHAEIEIRYDTNFYLRPNQFAKFKNYIIFSFSERLAANRQERATHIQFT